MYLHNKTVYFHCDAPIGEREIHCRTDGDDQQNAGVNQTE